VAQNTIGLPFAVCVAAELRRYQLGAHRAAFRRCWQGGATYRDTER